MGWAGSGRVEPVRVGPDRIGSGRVGWVGSGRASSNCVGLSRVDSSLAASGRIRLNSGSGMLAPAFTLLEFKLLDTNGENRNLSFQFSCFLYCENY